MKKVIYKYRFTAKDTNILLLPVGATILCVNIQHKFNPVLYAAVDPDEHKTEQRIIRCIGTGEEIEEVGSIYIGTFMLHDGRFVFHVYDQGIVKPDHPKVS